MKKILLLLCLIQSLVSFCQETNSGKRKKPVNTSNSSGDADNSNNTNNQKTKSYLETTQTIIYDFKTKEYIKSMVKPRVREPLVLKIENINRLAYDVTIKSKDVAIVDENFKEDLQNAAKDTENEKDKNESTPPKTITDTKLSKLSLKNQSVVDEIIDPKIAVNQSIIDGNEVTIKSTIGKRDNALLEIAALQLQLEIFKKNTLAGDSAALDKQISDKAQEINNFKNEIDSLETINISKKNEIIKIANTIEAVNQTFFQFNKLYDDVLYSSQRVKAIDENYQDFHQFALNPLLKYETYQTFIKDPKFILYQLSQYRSQIDEFDKNIRNFINFYNEAMNNWKIFDNIEVAEAKENIRIKYQLYKEEVDKIKASIDDIGLPTKLRKVEAIHAVLREKEAYEISSSPIQPLEDYVTFDVTVKNRDQSKLAEFDDNREFTYLEYTRGGIRFDFSTGIVINFIGNNDKYELQNVGTDGKQKKLILTDNNQFTPTLAGMFHTSFRTSGIWAFGLTLGASVNVETFELGSLFPGVSLLIGKKQKFIISAGPAFRQVEELKDNYDQNGIYNSTDFNDDTQLTSKQFRLGFFCGITYNLTQKQRAKFKIGTN
ncbi:MAG: hypothetical protein ABI576_20615 [Flavobacterium sp.]